MKTSVKILLALMGITGSAYTVVWFSTAHELEKIAQERFHLLQELVDTKQGELYGNVRIQGFPFRVEVAITNVQLDLNGETDYLVKIQEPIVLSAFIFGSHYTFVMPKKIQIEYKEGATPHAYTILMDKPSKLSVKLNIRPIDVWVRYHVHHALSSLTVENVQGFNGMVSSGKLLLDIETILGHWEAQSLDLLQSPIDSNRETITLNAHLGHIVAEDALYEQLKAKKLFDDVKPENWIDFKDVGFQLDVTAERSGKSDAFFTALLLHSELGNQYWMFQIDFDLKTKIQKDVLPIGTGTVLFSHPSVFFDSIKDTSIPLNTVMALQEMVTQFGIPGKEPDTLLFSFERNAEAPLRINGTPFEEMAMLFFTKKEPLLAPTPAATTLPPPPPPPPEDPNKQKADREQRVQQWVDDYEKNIEHTLKAHEATDIADKELIEQEDLLKNSEEEIKAALEREKKAQEELKAFQTFQKNKKFARPDA